MVVGSLHMTGDALAFIQAEAEKAYPVECCGLLVGTSNDVGTVEVTDVVPADNHATDPHRFLIDPQVQFDWMRKLRGTARRIIGHYHSHPNGQPRPSEYDGEMAQEAGQVWLIVAIDSGKVGEARAFVSQAESPKFTEIFIDVGA
jgi:proteasome lid subunit RPN8/RPN11